MNSTNNKKLYGYIDDRVLKENPLTIINKSSDYPLIPAERDGVISDTNTTLNKVILDVKVYGNSEDIKNNYFQINYFQNKGKLGHGNTNGIRVLMYPRDTYSSISEGIEIHSPSDSPLNYDRQKDTIYTEEIVCEKNKGIKVLITINVKNLPKEGTALRMSLKEDNAWSWIIDPSNYVIKDIEDNISFDVSLNPKISNKSNTFPMTLGNTYFTDLDLRPNPNPIVKNRIEDIVLNCILDTKVFAPKDKLQNKLFKIDYIYYGVFNSDYLGFSISSYDKDAYTKATSVEELNSTRVNLIGRGDNISKIDTNSVGTETFRFESTMDKDISFEVTMDMGVLNKYYKTSISMWANTSAESHYVTYIIDETNYYISNPSTSHSLVDEYANFKARTNINGIMAVGASLINSVNGWFEKSCSTIGVKYYNKAIGGKTTYDFVDLILNDKLCNSKEFEDSDVFVIQFASSEGLNNFDKQTRKYEEYLDVIKNVSREELPALITQGEALDFILKWWQQECEKQENNTNSKWYSIRGGKPLRLVFVTHWHDSRTYYNVPIREVALKWGGTVCELDKHIGFSKEITNSKGSQISLQYSMDSQRIDGILYGWHPSRGKEGEYIQNKMSNIFINTILNKVT